MGPVPLCRPQSFTQGPSWGSVLPPMPLLTWHVLPDPGRGLQRPHQALLVHRNTAQPHCGARWFYIVNSVWLKTNTNQRILIKRDSCCFNFCFELCTMDREDRTAPIIYPGYLAMVSPSWSQEDPCSSVPKSVLVSTYTSMTVTKEVSKEVYRTQSL